MCSYLHPDPISAILVSTVSSCFSSQLTPTAKLASKVDFASMPRRGEIGVELGKPELRSRNPHRRCHSHQAQRQECSPPHPDRSLRELLRINVHPRSGTGQHH